MIRQNSILGYSKTEDGLPFINVADDDDTDDVDIIGQDTKTREMMSIEWLAEFFSKRIFHYVVVDGDDYVFALGFANE